MSDTAIRRLLEAYREGTIETDRLVEALRDQPFHDLGFAKVDHHRAFRKGFPEVIFGLGKTPEQILRITENVFEKSERVLVTRVTPEAAEFVLERHPHGRHHAEARCLVFERTPPRTRPGIIGVLTAGTGDHPVAEEAVVTAECMGNRVDRIYDIGVAGLHRLLHRLEAIEACRVLIVVAGMEGALPSVVSGLVDRPLIAVPTSTGYGAHLGGLTPMMAMLTSCASGVTVVNIDNGFGAAYAASQINAMPPSVPTAAD